MNKLLKEFLSYVLTEAKSAQDPMLSYVGKDGKSYSKKASVLAGYRKDSPGRQAYDKWKASQTTTGKPAQTATKQKSTVSVEPKGRAVTKSAGKPKPDVPQSDEVPMSDAPGNIPPKPLTKGSAAADEDTLKKQEESMESRGFDTPDDADRFNTFTKLWRSFLGAPTYEEQVKAVRALAELKLIQGGISGKKIYMHPNLGLPYKVMCGPSGNGTYITKLMNKIAQDEGIDIEPYDESKSASLADISGKHNEAGVTAYLDPSKSNQAAYKQLESKYGTLGGDTAAADKLNRDAADAVRKTLPKGAKITSCSQVGGVGAKRLKELGIDPKTDPTDILLEYEVGGKKRVMKISAKIYTNPRNITMKNAGLTSAGADYLGEPEGSKVDTLWKDLSKKYKWTGDMSDDERNEQKRKLRQEYLQTFSQNMEKLAKTEKGQERLAEMWKKVHGCGKDVHTLVVDKKSGKSELKSPDYYCNPTRPFKVKYDGTKVVIEMKTGGPQTLQIDLKTESSGGVKLLFRHIVRDKK